MSKQHDLLGGDYFVTSDSDFESDNGQGGLGDPDYNYTNYVNWLGLFGQAEYAVNALKAYAMAGATTVKYTYWNHFKDASNYIIVMCKLKMPRSRFC